MTLFLIYLIGGSLAAYAILAFIVAHASLSREVAALTEMPSLGILPEFVRGLTASEPEGGAISPIAVRFARRLKAEATTGAQTYSLEEVLWDLEDEMKGRVAGIRFVAASSVFIGLLGTLLGLIASTQSMRTMAENGLSRKEQMEQFRTTLLNLLGGFSGSFGSAIGGVIVSLIAAFLIYRYERGCDFFVARLRNWGNGTLKPVLDDVCGIRSQAQLVSTLEYRLPPLLNALASATQALTKAFGAFDETIARNEAATTALAAAASTLATSHETLGAQIGEANRVIGIVGAQQKAFADANRSLQETANQNLERIRAVEDRFSGGIDSFGADVATIRTAITDTQTRQQEVLAEFSRTLDQNRDYATRIGQLIDNIPAGMVSHRLVNVEASRLDAIERALESLRQGGSPAPGGLAGIFRSPETQRQPPPQTQEQAPPVPIPTPQRVPPAPPWYRRFWPFNRSSP